MVLDLSLDGELELLTEPDDAISCERRGVTSIEREVDREVERLIGRESRLRDTGLELESDPERGLDARGVMSAEVESGMLEELERALPRARVVFAPFFDLRFLRGLFEPDESNFRLELDAIFFLNPSSCQLHQSTYVSRFRIA